MPWGRRPFTLTAHGRTLTLKQWAAETGLRVSTLQMRVYSRWPPERIVDTPLIPRAEKGRPTGAVRPSAVWQDFDDCTCIPDRASALKRSS
jgi:hypothetical protein